MALDGLSQLQEVERSLKEEKRRLSTVPVFDQLVEATLNLTAEVKRLVFVSYIMIALVTATLVFVALTGHR